MSLDYLERRQIFYDSMENMDSVSFLVDSIIDGPV